MTILKQGKLPTEYYYGECAKCGTIFQAIDAEVNTHIYSTAPCPLCHTTQRLHPYEMAKQMLSDNGITIETDATSTFPGKPIISSTRTLHHNRIPHSHTTTEYLIQSTPKNTITLNCSGTASPEDIQKIITKLKQLSI
jgi:hypothetical protein